MRKGMFALGLGVLLWVVGCGAGGKPVKTEGVVTLDGKPLDGATVEFHPDPPGKGSHIAAGRTGGDGTFHLTTFNTGDGAMPGTYKVLVSKTEEMKTEGAPTGAGDPKAAMDMASKMKMMGKKGPPHPDKEKSPVPPMYNDLGKTPLKFTVPHSGPIKIELSSKGG
jgi:hypothetical protein